MAAMFTDGIPAEDENHNSKKSKPKDGIYYLTPEERQLREMNKPILKVRQRNTKK